MKVLPDNEVVDSEKALFGDSSDDSGIEYNPVPANKKQRQRKIDNEDDCKVIHEKDLKKKSVKAIVEESKNKRNEDDRVLHTSFNISPYAINLISMIKRVNTQADKNNELIISSRSKVLLDVTSYSIDLFMEMMKDNYTSISIINQLASGINASCGKVNIIQPTIKIDMSIDEESERVDSLILSSVQTKVKMMSEEFGISPSCIVEFLIYLYICNSNNPIYLGSKKYCEERINNFKEQLDKFILESSQVNTEDESALIRIGFKMAALNVVESTRTNSNFKNICHKTMSVDIGDEFDINAKVILRKKNGKRSYDEKNSKGIFKQKNGRKSKKLES